jgi:hypothetical protein
MVEKEVYLRWRDDPCTKEMHRDLGKLIEELVSSVVTNYDSTEKRDAYLKGWIKALVEISEWTPTLKEEIDE